MKFFIHRVIYHDFIYRINQTHSIQANIGVSVCATIENTQCAAFACSMCACHCVLKSTQHQSFASNNMCLSITHFGQLNRTRRTTAAAAAEATATTTAKQRKLIHARCAHSTRSLSYARRAVETFALALSFCVPTCPSLALTHSCCHA